jgi:hypothetical protein
MLYSAQVRSKLRTGYVIFNSNFKANIHPAPDITCNQLGLRRRRLLIDRSGSSRWKKFPLGLHSVHSNTDCQAREKSLIREYSDLRNRVPRGRQYPLRQSCLWVHDVII